MKKRKVIYQLILSILILFTARTGLSKITTEEFTDYTVENQGILPNTHNSPRHSYNDVIGRNALDEGYNIVLGLNIASDTGQQLTGVKIEHWGLEGYPFLLLDSAVITDRNGTILGVLGSSDGIISGTITIPGGTSIPSDDSDMNAGDDFFIAIRTRDDAIDGSIMFFKVPKGAVEYSPPEADDQINEEVETNRIVCELIVGDLMPIEFQPPHPPSDPDKYLKPPKYFYYHPGEMIRPRYDTDSYQHAKYPLKRFIPQILPYNVETAVIGIACAQRNVVWNGTANPWKDVENAGSEEKLTSITLTFTDTGKNNFDPTKSFFDPVNRQPTISLWRDENGNGKWEPDIDSKLDISLSDFSQVSQNEWEVTISGSQGGYIERIDRIREGTTTSSSVYDYFVVVELYPDPDDQTYRQRIGQDFKIWIKPGDVRFGPIGWPSQYAGIDINKTKTIYCNLHLDDISQRRVDPIETEKPVDKTYNTIPVFGINICGSPDYPDAKIKDIKVEILAFENFDPQTDLAPLSTSGDERAGITLWRDNKERGNIGSFDIEDTFVPTSSSGWVDDGFVNDPEYGPCHLYHCIISTLSSATDQGVIYPYDWSSEYQDGAGNFDTQYEGDDFFVCLRTKDLMSYGAKFRVRIPEDGGLTLTSPFEGRYNSLSIDTEEIEGNVFAKITSLTDPGNPGLVANSPPTPVFKVELDDNNSGKSPKLEQMTVEFYDRGNFSLDDLASFNPIYPVFNSSTGWYDVTNFDVDALKQCGVVIYQDDGDGDFNENLDTPILIKRYRIPSWTGGPSAYQFEFKNSVAIPAILFVVIRTSGTFTPGDSFDCGIVGWGLNESAWESWGSRAIGIVDNNGVKSNVYVRAQSGIFNPESIGSIFSDISSEYKGIWINWNNNTSITSDRFQYYEILRTDTTTGITESIATIYDYNANSYFNSVDGPFPPEEGVQYQYIVRMYYLQGGEEKTIDSNISPDPSDPYYFHKGRILGWPDYMSPDDVRAVGGINSITVYWRDRTFDPDHPDMRATQFMIRRINLTDNTYFETIIDAHYDPEWVDYTYVDSDIAATQTVSLGNLVPSSAGTSEPVYMYDPSNPDKKEPLYKYEIYALRPPGNTSYTPGSGGGGGCFIATAAYGSYQEKHVWILRQFRDKYLLTNRIGKAFVRWYYRHSPKYASIIAKNEFLRFLTRIFLTPLYLLAYIFLKTNYLLLLFLFLLNTGIIFSIRLYSKFR